MTTNQTARVLELLKRFNNGEKVCIETLQNDEIWEGKSEKTIRRDLDVIKEYFPQSYELIRGEKGCYKAVTKESFENFLKPDLLSLLVQTFSLAQKSNMFENLDIESSDRKILESKIKETSQCYEFKNKPFESKVDDMVIFKKLESAIKHQKYINIEYPIRDKVVKLEVKPYKIVFMNENFYLACEVDNQEFEFSIYRISKIKNIEDTKKTYQKNYEIEDFIKSMQTPFALYQKEFRKHLIEVKLEVSKEKAFFFKSKQYLKSQKFVEEKTNGNIVYSYQITQLLEIEELIKRWLPHVKVIEPLELKEKIETELQEYLK
jgi:predicted DNA-binding transcriptional regulator YafY